MKYSIMVNVALFGWIPLCLALFALLPGRKACIWGFLIGWLFLPEATIKLQGFTTYDKMSATCVMVMISALIFDSATVFQFRPKIWDLPMLLWCICPILSSDSNGLGWYDGLSASAYQIFNWGLPYLIGRIYFSDLPGLRELAEGLIIGGLIYVPLCLYEIRMSPQLHRLVYGYHQYEFGQSIRGTTYRPMVFMQTGLAVGMWMAAATLTAFACYTSKIFQRVAGMPMGVVFFVLLATAIGCRSMGAIGLLLVGMGVMVMTRWTQWPIWALLLIMLPPAYMYIRGTNMWDGRDMVKTLTHDDPRMGQSLRVRLLSERIMVDHAMKRPLLGWGGWNRFRAQDENGNDMGVPDGMWLIALGRHGMIGLIAFTTTLLLPLILMIWRIPPRLWIHPGAAPAVAMAIVSVLYMGDCLMNAMFNPIFMLGVGGVCGLSISLRHPQQDAVTYVPAQPLPQAAAQIPKLPASAPAGA